MAFLDANSSGVLPPGNEVKRAGAELRASARGPGVTGSFDLRFLFSAVVAGTSLTRQLLPDVVLLDVSMPGMGGVEATRRIRAECPGVQVIGLSMYDEAEQGKAIRDAGAVDYLNKTCPFETLIAAIRGSIDRR